ncbi:MAG: hypothetical protein IKR12_02825 [Clostridia bacterium]|nr:hypothetical protein [Clostridia bacterium]
MNKNIRKHKVKSLEEILFGLKKESNVLFGNFIATSEKIKNDVMVRNFWNLLIKCAKYNKPEVSMDMNASTLLALGTGQILYANGNPIAAGIADLTGLGLALSAFEREVIAEKNADVFAQKDKMIIAEPELYDIELVFNGYTRDDIDTSEYDGKAEYQKLHDEYSAKALHKIKTKLQRDLESDEEKTAQL